MTQQKFATALSEKDGEDALKEISLRIKATFPKSIKYILVFFTPHYQTSTIAKVINFTLKPQSIMGIQSPFLIYEDRVIEKGVVACCINDPYTEMKSIFVKPKQLMDDSSAVQEDIEASLRSALKGLGAKRSFSLPFLSYEKNPYASINAIKLSTGKTMTVFGAGFMKRYGDKNYVISGDTASEGFLGILGKGLEIQLLKIGGFLPVGKPFIITRAVTERNIIMEINGEPAINIYKHYLGSKFDAFKKNYLFPLYPLGIRNNGSLILITVTNYLEDGSLVCVGDVKENQKGHIMVLHHASLIETIKEKLGFLEGQEGLLIIIDSLARKRILKDVALEEIKFIKKTVGDKFKMIGTYSDYSVFSDENTREAEWEAANILMAAVK